MQKTTSKLELARDWFLAQVDAIPAERWTADTLCAGWTAKHVVAHVATGDQLFQGLIYDATGRDRAGLDLPADREERMRRFETLRTEDPEVIKGWAHRESERVVPLVLEALEKTPEALVNAPYGRVPMNVVRALRLNEYVIHGHDLEPAIGRKMAIPDWFIDRALGDAVVMMVRLHQRSPHKGEAATFHLHRTDGEGEWTLRAENGEAAASSGHGNADVAFRGSGESLYWFLMGRGRAEELGIEVHGEPALAQAFKVWFPGP